MSPSARKRSITSEPGNDTVTIPQYGAVRRTEYVALSTLLADPKNPKAHDLGTIDASIARFGYVEPIVRDDRTGYMVSGHGRAETLRAMHERGETPPEGVTQDEGTGEWFVPVVTGWASRTDAEARAALIALNRTTELGGWVDDALLGLLDDLRGLGDDALVGVGYSDDDIAELRARLDDGSDGAGGFGPLDGLPGRLDEGAVKHCPYCNASWRDTADGPRAVEES